jgi:hypothetical protein
MSKYVVISEDSLEISEYFYYYCRLWENVEKTQQGKPAPSYEEILQGIERRKKLKAELKQASQETAT